MKTINRQELEYVIEFTSKISQGVDPISGIELPDDTVLNNRRYSQVFAYVTEALCYLFDKFEKENYQIYEAKSSFYLSASQMETIEISQEPISVSEVAYNVNTTVDSNMKKIKATQITTWLTELGYLQEDIEGKTSHKICTDRAIEIGIYPVVKKNRYGNSYYVNLYNEAAQKLIIKNINEISQL